MAQNSTTFRRAGIPITAALVATIALLTALVGLLCAWLVASMGAADIRRQEQILLSEISTDVARDLSHALAERAAEIRAIRDLFERELAAAPASEKRAVMERARANRHYFTWMGVVDESGAIRVGTNGLLEGANVAGRNWFEGARRSPAFFGEAHPATLLSTHVGNADGAPLYLLDIALPLRDRNGAANGVIGSHFNWRLIEEIIKRAIDRPIGATPLSAALVGADGKILFDTAGATGAISGALQQIPPGRMIEANWPSEADTSFVVAAAAPAVGVFNGMNWRVLVREPAAAMHAGIRQMTWRIAGVSLVVGLLFSLLGVFAVRLITNPLRVLVAHLDRFAEDAAMPVAVNHSRITEIQNLRDAFTRMAAKVSTQKEQLRDTQFEILRALATASDVRDHETANHSLRMSLYCQRLARLAGKTEAEAEQIFQASQLHDVGKIGIPDEILLKTGKYNEAERAVMQRHCEIGGAILMGKNTPLTVLARSIALTHHERWDGDGYPNRLAGASIPLEGRLAAICDVFDALLSSRPYKQGWSIEKVTAYLQEQAGRHFDPKLTVLFLDHIDDFIAIRNKLPDQPDAMAPGGVAAFAAS